MSDVRKFAVFDIDGTLIRWQLYHAVVDALGRLGYVDKKDLESIKAARMLWKVRDTNESFKSYERQLVQTYGHILSKITYEQFTQAASTVFEQYKDQVYAYTRELIGTLKGQGYILFAVSGSQIEVVRRVAEHWGFDDAVGTVYEQKAGRFTGKVATPIGSKHVALAQLVDKHEVSYSQSIAVGDSEGDISMLESVEQPIAFNPSKKLLAIARAKGWKIVVERKNVIYNLEPKDGIYLLA